MKIQGILLLLIIISFSTVTEAKHKIKPVKHNKKAKTEYVSYATWYGAKYHLKKTSSGEIFHKDSLTAAHRTLKYNTLVEVTNPETNESVIVRINDRGPFGNAKYDIDLSEEAARKLSFVKKGVQKVVIKILSNT